MLTAARATGRLHARVRVWVDCRERRVCPRMCIFYNDTMAKFYSKCVCVCVCPYLCLGKSGWSLSQCQNLGSGLPSWVIPEHKHFHSPFLAHYSTKPNFRCCKLRDSLCDKNLEQVGPLPTMPVIITLEMTVPADLCSLLMLGINL